MKKLVTFILTVLSCLMLTACVISERKADFNKGYQFPIALNTPKEDVVGIIGEKDSESPIDNSFEWYTRNGFVIKYDSYSKVDRIIIHNGFDSGKAVLYRGYIYNNVKLGDSVEMIIDRLGEGYTFESEEKTGVYDKYTWMLDGIRIIVEVDKGISRSIEIEKGY